MGDFNVKGMSSRNELHNFTRHLLNDVQALEYMLENSWFETDVIRIGAEQELCIVDKNWKPAPLNLELLEKINNPYITNELAKFNLEINLKPQVFKDNCLSVLESEINSQIELIRKVAKEFETDIVLTGILPSIRKFDVEEKNITPIDRYYALMEALSQLRGGSYELKISGIDELNIKLDTALIEAANTGFQVHLQVTPDDFVKKYNLSQAIAGPVLASAVNSPLLFGKRLWSETRIALFQQSVDTRITSEHIRDRQARVMFGNKWLEGDITDIYKEDILKFRILLGANFEKKSLDMIENGEVPNLKALTVHNSTVYRWNRACYGISGNGKPHLRIENRIFPSGPSVVDEIANTAFWLGLMNGYGDVYPDITKVLDFDDVKNNFFVAAQVGLRANFHWTNGKVINATELIKKELLPIAKEGLMKANVNKNDIDKYLNLIEARVDKNTTGSSWLLKSISNLSGKASKEEIITAITASTAKNQKSKLPISEWKEAALEDLPHWKPTEILVEEFMTTDLLTVHPDDLIEFVADMIDWGKAMYIPVESKKGKLAGLVTYRNVLRHMRKKLEDKKYQATLIKDIMLNKPHIVRPDQKLTEASDIMEKYKIGCLPVVKDNKLIGLVTEKEFYELGQRLFKRL